MNKMIKEKRAKGILIVTAGLMMFGTMAAQAAQYKPFILASKAAGDLNVIIDKTRAALIGGGFEIAGEYSPFTDTHIIIVTNDALKSNAAKSKMGGFGAIQRVAVTKYEGEIQVAYTNPNYMAHVYRMKGDLSGVRSQLKAVIGGIQEFGMKTGKTPGDLNKYHYMFMMPYFDDPIEIAKFDSYDEALGAVEAGLKAGRGGSSRIYRVDISGKKETVFGVGLSGAKIECSGDKRIMDSIDGEKLRGSAHLPYDLIVNENGEVVALHGKFRIAQSFPDLSMVAGDYTFFKIMCAPGAIEDAFTEVTGK